MNISFFSHGSIKCNINTTVKKNPTQLSADRIFRFEGCSHHLADSYGTTGLFFPQAPFGKMLADPRVSQYIISTTKNTSIERQQRKNSNDTTINSGLVCVGIEK